MQLDLTQFDAVTFDVYGTLIDWEPSIIAMLQSVADQHNIDLSRDQLLLEFDRARAQLQRVRPALLYPEVLRQAYNQFCERYRVPPNNREREVFSSAVMLWPAFDDAIEALAYLHSHLKIGLFSNIDNESLSFSVRKLRLQPDVIITAEGVGAYKPDHAHFHAGFAEFEKFGISPNRVLHVGQSLRADVIPANALDLKCVWIRRPGRSLGSRPEDAVGAQPDATFDTMHDLALALSSQRALTRDRT
ncbi:HAD family hydrolase [Caballeronia sordidicola]|uniref:HAD family hydrolase n=1 Tax=Caballeronia sordidicola TaxID=196367 RepID=UPI00094DB7C7|nr:HAD family hydrolase [Caballeronia sordidicola]